MFGQSTTEIESKIRELYSKESELSQRQQAVLASTVAGDADAERYMTDPEAAVAALTSASLRARAESDLIEASVSSIRRKRGDLISKVIGKRVADAETARDVKQDELAAAKEETARLHAEYTAAAQAEMRLTGELEAAVYAIQQALLAVRLRRAQNWIVILYSFRIATGAPGLSRAHRLTMFAQKLKRSRPCVSCLLLGPSGHGPRVLKQSCAVCATGFWPHIMRYPMRHETRSMLQSGSPSRCNCGASTVSCTRAALSTQKRA